MYECTKGSHVLLNFTRKACCVASESTYSLSNHKKCENQFLMAAFHDLDACHLRHLCLQSRRVSQALRNAGPKFGFYNTRRRVDYEVGFCSGLQIFRRSVESLFDRIETVSIASAFLLDTSNFSRTRMSELVKRMLDADA